jgi:hypothetical protein
MTEDLQNLRDQAEAATAETTPEEVKEQEKQLLLGIFDAWPQIVEGICAGVNDHLKDQVAIIQALDPTPWRVKAVRPEALRAAVEEKGMDAVVEVLQRIDTNSREMYRRAKRLRAEHDRLAGELAAKKAAGGSNGGPSE